MKILALRHTSPQTSVKNLARYHDKIALKTKSGVQIIRILDIIYLEADGNYTRIIMNDGSCIFSSKTLKKFDQLLLPQFLRIHQSYIINPDFITWINSNFSSLKLNRDQMIPIASSKRSTFKQFVTEHYSNLR